MIDMDRWRTRLLRLMSAMGLAIVTLIPTVASAASSPSPDSSSAKASTSSPASESPAAEDMVTWAVQPSTAQGADGRRWIELTLDPGDQVTEHLAVHNVGSRAATFTLVAADGLMSQDGAFAILPADRESVGAGTWITLAETTVELGAGESRVVPFTVTVPKNATPGDYPAGVAASLRTTNTDGVGLDSRVGFRVLTRVAGELAPALDVTEVSATYQPTWNPFATGSIVVTYTVANTGNTRIGAKGTAQADLLIGDASADLSPIAELMPGEKRDGKVTLTGVFPAGSATTKVQVQGVGVEGVDVDVSSVRADANASTTAMPWPQLLALLALVGLVVGGFLLRRHRQDALKRKLAAARAEGRMEAVAP